MRQAIILQAHCLPTDLGRGEELGAFTPLLRPALPPLPKALAGMTPSLSSPCLNGQSQGKDLPMVMSSPSDHHRDPSPGLQFTSPTPFGCISFDIWPFLSHMILKFILCIRTSFPTRLQTPPRQGQHLVLLLYPQQDMSQCQLLRAEII